MTWFKVDDGLHSHPKTRRAGLEAVGLWCAAGSYASDYLTDGFVPRWYVESWPKGIAIAARLVKAGFWYEDEQEGHKGWSFHQWEERNPTRQQVEADRAATRARQTKYRESHREPVVSNGVTDGVTNTAPTRPDPSRPSLGLGSQSSDRSNGRAKDGLTDEEIDKIKTRLHVSAGWAQQVATDILNRADRTPDHPGRYVLAAIEKEPDRYKPTLQPVAFRSLDNCEIHIGELADNCRACAADRLAAS